MYRYDVSTMCICHETKSKVFINGFTGHVYHDIAASSDHCKPLTRVPYACDDAYTNFNSAWRIRCVPEPPVVCHQLLRTIRIYSCCGNFERDHLYHCIGIYHSYSQRDSVMNLISIVIRE